MTNTGTVTNTGTFQNSNVVTNSGVLTNKGTFNNSGQNVLLAINSGGTVNNAGPEQYARREWDGPDRMYVNARHIVMVEPVSLDSKVAQLIAETKQK